MAQDLPRAVLDTSVLVPVWSRLLLADLATRPVLYTPIWCEWIIAETWRVLTVLHFRQQATFSPADERRLSVLANSMLLHLLPIMTIISVVPPFDEAWPTATDQNDLPIWTAALRSGAAFIVSHNLHDFPPRDANGLCRYQGIEFITAENFVREVLGLDFANLGVDLPTTPRRLTHRRRA